MRPNGTDEKNQEKNGILVAIDVDNLLISSAGEGHKFSGYDLSTGFENMFQWMEAFGRILAVHLYIPPSRGFTDIFWHKMWELYNNNKNKFAFELVYCPKLQPEKGYRKLDNVDSHLIFHTRKLISLISDKVKYFCLASGDLHYAGLLWELKREWNIEIAFAIGSKQSLSGRYGESSVVSKHPKTFEDLIYYFLPKKDFSTQE